MKLIILLIIKIIILLIIKIVIKILLNLIIIIIPYYLIIIIHHYLIINKTVRVKIIRDRIIIVDHQRIKRDNLLLENKVMILRKQMV